MIYFFLLTVLTVSLDSFICGFSISTNKNKKFITVIGIALTVFIMCLITNYLGIIFCKILTEKTANFGGIILIFIGFYNLFKKNEKFKQTTNNILIQAISLGFAVGLDGAFANLSLSLMGINKFYVPLTIALMHALLIYLGLTFSQLKFIKNNKIIGVISPLILIFLGLFKLLSIFI